MHSYKQQTEDQRERTYRDTSASDVYIRRRSRSRNALKENHIKLDFAIGLLKKEYPQIKASQIETFQDLPLSSKTLKGLEEAKFEKPTEIQQQTIGPALQGHDVLGAAKTGSGKTLAFVIPILEKLYCSKVTALDSLSALIISPTRELAYQTYQVIKKVGAFHDFSAGLVIGGVVKKKEADIIGRMHIIVATPGRLLQHMEETYMFNCDSLQILVLDECDRMLHYGFKEAMTAILEYFPSSRQTLLFSATQTKNVDDIVRVGLKNPVYISVHEKSENVTPDGLEQNYIDVELKDKINTLWFFIKNHLKSKILVFMHASKQVRFLQMVFSKLRPGVMIRALYGNMNQLKRVQVYDEFCRKKNIILFATDIASRGLDFPGVDWVVQMDAPENIDTYIHRVGRTARYQNNGEALLFLMPSEKIEMLRMIGEKGLAIHELEVNARKIGQIANALASLLSQDNELNEFAKGAFLQYMKGIYMMKNAALFDVSALDHEAYALSLGLFAVPRIRFIDKRQKEKKEKEKQENLRAMQIEATKRKKDLVAQRKAEKKLSNSSSDDSSNDDSSSDDSSCDDSSTGDSSSGEDSDSSSEDTNEKETNLKTKKAAFSLDLSDNEDNLLRLKHEPIAEAEQPQTNPAEIKRLLQTDLEEKSKRTNRPQSKRDLANAMKRHGIRSQHTKFTTDEQGDSGADEEYSYNIEEAKQRLREADVEDKKAHNQRVREKHIKLKEKEQKLQLKKAFSSGLQPQFVLGGGSDQSGDDGDEGAQSADGWESYDQSASDTDFSNQSEGVEESDDQSGSDIDEASQSEGEVIDDQPDDASDYSDQYASDIASANESKGSVVDESDNAEPEDSDPEPPVKRKKSKSSFLSTVLPGADTGFDQRLTSNTLDEDEQFALRLLQQ